MCNWTRKWQNYFLYKFKALRNKLGVGANVTENLNIWDLAIAKNYKLLLLLQLLLNIPGFISKFNVNFCICTSKTLTIFFCKHFKRTYFILTFPSEFAKKYTTSCEQEIPQLLVTFWGNWSITSVAVSYSKYFFKQTQT